MELKLGKYFEAFKKLPNFLLVLDGFIQWQCKKVAVIRRMLYGGPTHKCDAVICVLFKGYNVTNLKFVKN
jgi:hypothetical protein